MSESHYTTVFILATKHDPSDNELRDIMDEMLDETKRQGPEPLAVTVVPSGTVNRIKMDGASYDSFDARGGFTRSCAYGALSNLGPSRTERAKQGVTSK